MLATVSGLSFSAGDGTASATITFTGTITNVNAAMNWMTFAPTTNFVGSANLQLWTYSLGNHTVTCTIGNLHSDKEIKLSITVQANQTGLVSNTAMVTGNEPDPRSSNNSATTRTKGAIGLASLTLSPNPVKKVIPINRAD